MNGLYVPGRSVVHRAPAGIKLVLLAAALGILSTINRPFELLPAGALTVSAAAMTGVPWARYRDQLRPLAFPAPVMFTAQVLFIGWSHAVVVTGSLILSFALAAVLTLTTRVSAILDACTTALRPLERFGVNPERIGLLLALTIRCLPLIESIITNVGQARKARGATGSVLALAAPAVIRALRTADALGEALTARGFDD